MLTVLNYVQNYYRKRLKLGLYFGSTNHQGERDYVNDVSFNIKNERWKKMDV